MKPAPAENKVREFCTNLLITVGTAGALAWAFLPSEKPVEAPKIGKHSTHQPRPAKPATGVLASPR